MAEYKVQANAKINLGLRITGRREDGYHTLSTIFQEIDLSDELVFIESEEFGFSCSDPTLPTDDTNLCVIAYKRMKSLVPDSKDFHIHLNKKIPTGAGLGGGSSDAATVLKFLNKKWKINLNIEKLKKIGLELGCDIPFFFMGKTQGATGLGEELFPLELPHSFYLLLVCPNIHISTVWAYKQFNLTNKKENFKFRSLLDKRIFWALFENQFESVVFPSYPKIGKIKSDLEKENSEFVSLSGSGSTVFGIFKTLRLAEKAREKFEKYPTFISHPILHNRN